jgi:ubiquinone/menaquinone biosynthesis C-methylase UbiE
MQLFDGPAARLIAKAMARGNREAEAEAIAELDPAPDATVLAIGFGPGVGLKLLAPRVSRVVGVDPSRVMVSERNSQREQRCRPLHGCGCAPAGGRWG